MQVDVSVFACGMDMFIPGTKFGQTLNVEVPVGATVGDLFDKLGVPQIVFGVLVNGRHATIYSQLNHGDRVTVLEAINGG